MKKLLLTLVLPINADPDTILETGDKTKMWIPHDFSTLRLDFISAKQKQV